MRAEAHYHQGVKYQRDGNLEASILELTEATSGDPSLTKAHYALGSTWLMMLKGVEAEQAFLAALALEPDKLDAQIGLGKSLRLQRRFDEAALSFDRAHKLSSKSAEPLTLLAETMRAKGSIDRAVELYREAAALSEDGDLELPLFEIASMLEEEGNYAKAAEVYEGVIKAARESKDELFKQAEFFESKGRPEQATRVRNSAKEARVKLFVHMGKLGDLRLQAKQPAAALDAYRQGLEIFPNDLSTWELIASLQALLGRTQEAKASCARVLELNPKSVAARVELAEMAFKGRKMEEAKAELDAAIEHMPGDTADALLSRIARLELELGNADKAELILSELVKSNSEELSLLVDLARARKMKGDRMGAAAACLEATILFKRKGEGSLGECGAAP